MDDLDHLLARRHRTGDLGADGTLLDLLDKGPDHFERHVGFDQRAANLAHGIVDVRGVEGATATQAFEDFAKPVGKALEHFWSFSAVYPRDIGSISPNAKPTRGRNALADGGLRDRFIPLRGPGRLVRNKA
ncbi:hypothetical protein D3C86_1707340 [compost metagenome]